MGNRMRKNIIFIGMSFLLASVLYPQDRQLMQKSDSLFVAGVELYKQGKYEEAVPLFAVSDSMDKAEMDSADVRRDYSAMWLASCYYKMGDTATAAGIDANYRFAPVDRRLTVKSDSLSQIGMEYANQGDYAKAIDYLTQCAEIEKSIVGDKHIFYGNTLNNIALCNSNLNNHAEAVRLGIEVLNIKKVVGKYTPTYANALSNLAIYY